MSREDLNNFIYAAERNFQLRAQLKKCGTLSRFQEIAIEYGFSISSKDIDEDVTSENIGKWFQNSRVAPIRKIP